MLSHVTPTRADTIDSELMVLGHPHASVTLKSDSTGNTSLNFIPSASPLHIDTNPGWQWQKHESKPGLYLWQLGDPADRVRMYFAPNGQVGIGTENPTSTLSVNGTLSAKEVVITVDGWADRRLQPDYPLMPLSQVKQYINEHGTLPEIPSEREVLTHGVNIGEMQVKLLAKIEELTLHAIKQNERLITLEQENARLQQQMAARQ
jgi:hypothetical protein